jgi:hypothetical protein
MVRLQKLQITSSEPAAARNGKFRRRWGKSATFDHVWSDSVTNPKVFRSQTTSPCRSPATVFHPAAPQLTSFTLAWFDCLLHTEKRSFITSPNDNSSTFKRSANWYSMAAFSPNGLMLQATTVSPAHHHTPGWEYETYYFLTQCGSRLREYLLKFEEL